jgi:signal peptidase I
MEEIKNNQEDAEPINQEMKKSSLSNKLIAFWDSWTGTFVVVFFVIFFVAQAFVIPSGSMIKTLLIGDMLFVKKFKYGVTIPTIPWIEVPLLPDFNKNGHLIEGDRPKRGDIVVFRYPKNPSIYYVKRCVASGGDLLLLKDKDLYIHHKEGEKYIKANFPKEKIVEIGHLSWVKNPYQEKHPGIVHDDNIVDNGMMPKQLFDFRPIKVPEDEFFMMGDNRDHSNDSRFWGTVPYKFVVGTPWMIYFSWDKDRNIRWERVFKNVEELENQMNEVKNDKNYNHKIEGIY